MQRPRATEYTSQGDRARRAAGARLQARGYLWVVSALLGCSGPPGAGLHLGTDLGTFHVTASETSNDCGVGALGETPSLAYDVELERDHTQLFWNGNSGTVSSDASFEESALVRMPVGKAPTADDPANFSAEPDVPAQPCVIERQDEVAGTLSGTDDQFDAFTASSSYAFAVEPDARCTLAEEASAGLPDLPCSIRYTLHGTRTRAPDKPAQATPDSPSAPR